MTPVAGGPPLAVATTPSLSESEHDRHRMITLRKYPTEVEAEVDRAILFGNGIRALVVRDNAGGMLPSLNLLSEVRLVVDDIDAAKARVVLGE